MFEIALTDRREGARYGVAVVDFVAASGAVSARGLLARHSPAQQKPVIAPRP
jgi:hypothetical protein